MMQLGIKLILSAMFLLCLLQMPYGFYQAVRFIGMLGFILLAYLSNQQNNKFEAIIYIALALLFQPFIKVALGRLIWNIIDLVVGIGLILSLLQRNKKIRPARYRSAKDTEISNSGKFSSPIRFDEKGNYISENNINYDVNYDNDYYRDQNKNQNDYYDKNNEKETIDIPCALLLREIENNSTFDEIIYFRTLAERELSDTDNGQQSWLKSWFSW